MGARPEGPADRPAAAAVMQHAFVFVTATPARRQQLQPRLRTHVSPRLTPQLTHTPTKPNHTNAPQVASSFSHMLNLHNLTEEVANTQTERAGRMGQLQLPTRSTNATFIKLTTQNGVDPAEVYDALCNQTVQLVLTAHPTQAFRQSLLKKYAQVRAISSGCSGCSGCSGSRLGWRRRLTRPRRLPPTALPLLPAQCTLTPHSLHPFFHTQSAKPGPLLPGQPPQQEDVKLREAGDAGGHPRAG